MLQTLLTRLFLMMGLNPEAWSSPEIYYGYYEDYDSHSP